MRSQSFKGSARAVPILLLAAFVVSCRAGTVAPTVPGNPAQQPAAGPPAHAVLTKPNGKPVYRVNSVPGNIVLNTDPSWAGAFEVPGHPLDVDVVRFSAAKWIWGPALPDPNGEIGGRVSKTFNLNLASGDPIYSGEIYCRFDHAGHVEVNGQVVGNHDGFVAGTPWTTTKRFDIKSFLQPGQNTITLGAVPWGCVGCDDQQFGMIATGNITFLERGGDISLSANNEFSPDGDGTNDTNPIDIKAVPNLGYWFLSAIGPVSGTVAIGIGDRLVNWTGTLLNGDVLPDGTYTLRLKTGGNSEFPDEIVRTVQVEIGRNAQSPSPSPTPPQLTLSVQHEAFSPDRPGQNPDDTKDTNTLQIGAAAGQAWSLSIQGHGVLKSGSGPQSLIWDGTLAGAKLPDGLYELSLEAESQHTSASVIIDTVRPTIADARIVFFEETGDSGEILEFKIDAGNLQVGAGVDPGSAEIIFDNAKFMGVSFPVLDANGSVRLKYKFESAGADEVNLKYSASISDLAGNSSRVRKKNGEYANSFTATDDAEIVAEALELNYAAISGESQTYKLLQASQVPPTVKIKPFGTYYPKCKMAAEIPFRYRFYIRRKGVRVEIPGSRYFYVQNNVFPEQAKSFHRFRETFTPFSNVKKLVWNGRDGIHDGTMGEFVPQGMYFISDEPSADVLSGGWVSSNPLLRRKNAKPMVKLPFLVSQHEVLTLDKWQTATDLTHLILDRNTVPARQRDYVYSKACHILQRHVYGNPYNDNQYRYQYQSNLLYPDGTRGSGRTIHPRAKRGVLEDVFSAYTSTLSASAPQLPYPGIFDEMTEFTWLGPEGRYPGTQAAIVSGTESTRVLKDLVGIADAIKSQDLSDVTISGERADGRAMPVVFSDYKVAWVGYLPMEPNQSGNPDCYSSIFPAWKDRDSHESKIFP